MHGNLELMWGHVDIQVWSMAVPSIAVEGGYKVSEHPVYKIETKSL